jgi:hypothetical protein
VQHCATSLQINLYSNSKGKNSAYKRTVVENVQKKVIDVWAGIVAEVDASAKTCASGITGAVEVGGNTAECQVQGRGIAEVVEVDAIVEVGVLSATAAPAGFPSGPW